MNRAVGGEQRSRDVTARVCSLVGLICVPFYWLRVCIMWCCLRNGAVPAWSYLFAIHKSQ